MRHARTKATRTVAAVAVAALAVTLSSVTSYADNPVPGPGTLRQEAAKGDILIGSGAVNPTYLDDPQFAQVLAEQFNSLSPENELKWNFVHPERDVYQWEGLDRLVAFADQHDMVVKGHGLISRCCNPDYLLDITDPVEFRAAMVEHFEAVMGRYQDTMDRWDVVTEPLATMGGSGVEHNDFYNVLGPDYIAEAFRIAHEADPDATLYINENLVETIPVKRQELYDLVAGLVADGVPIDGVALQMHLTYVGPEPGVLTDIVDSYRALGLEVSIAEMDVHTYDAAAQTQIYEDVITEALQAGVTDISFWGFTDKYAYTWLPGAKPLMFDEQYNPKGAFYATRDALAVHVDRTRPTATLVSPSSAGPFQQLSIQVDATDDVGLRRAVANIYRDGVLVKSTQTALDGARSGSHTATVSLPDGTYTIKYNSQDLAGNISKTRTFVVTVDS